MRPLILSLSPAPSTMVVLSLSMRDALGAAEVADGDVLELEAELLGDDLAAGEDGDVLEHLLAAIAEARGLDGGAVERAAELVDDERGERLALDVLGDDEERLLAARRSPRAPGGDPSCCEIFFSRDEDVRVLEDGLHALGIGDEVRARGSRGRTACPRRLRGSSRRSWLSSTVMTPSLPTFSIASASLLADFLVAVGADGADLRDLLRVLGRLRHLLERLDDGLDGLVDAALDLHRVVPGGDELASPRGRSPGRARWRWWCRRRRRRWSSTRPRAPSARPCSRSGSRARSPWRR